MAKVRRQQHHEWQKCDPCNIMNGKSATPATSRIPKVRPQQHHEFQKCDPSNIRNAKSATPATVRPQQQCDPSNITNSKSARWVESQTSPSTVQLIVSDKMIQVVLPSDRIRVCEDTVCMLDALGPFKVNPEIPFVFGRNLQYQPVRKWPLERNAIGRTPARFKRAGMGTNGILECKSLLENAHRTGHHKRTKHRSPPLASCWPSVCCDVISAVVSRAPLTRPPSCAFTVWTGCTGVGGKRTCQPEQRAIWVNQTKCQPSIQATA
jgi:hypothetical protein